MNVSHGGSLKMIVVGDTGVGKTSIVKKFVSGNYDATSKPTVFDNYAVAYSHGSSSYVLSIFDTSGQEQFATLRTLSYLACDVFIVCFSVISPKSYKSVEAMWVPEIWRYCPGAALVLVGTQSDLREKPTSNTGDNRDSVNTLSDESVVSENKGRLLCERIGAKSYVECYREKTEDIRRVFHTAATAAIASLGTRCRRREQTTKCSCVIV